MSQSNFFSISHSSRFDGRILSRTLMLLGVLWLGACSGSRPENIGVRGESLANCPSSPNCVASHLKPEDKEHYIAPLDWPQEMSADQVLDRLEKIVRQSERTKIIKKQKDYLYAEYKSKLMGYVDDVEFYLVEKAGKIHVRSASRIGYGDWGVNRKRIESVRAELKKAATEKK